MDFYLIYHLVDVIPKLTVSHISVPSKSNYDQK